MKVRGPIPEAKPTPHHPDEIGPGPLRLDADRVALGFGGWQGVEQVSPDLMELTKRSLDLQQRWAERLSGLFPPDAYSPEEARARLALGESLVRESGLRLAGRPWLELTGEAIDLADFTTDEIRWELGVWRERLGEDQNQLHDLIRLNVARPRELIDRAVAASGVSREAFWFVFQQVGGCALRPTAEGLAALVDDTVWKRGVCPICGNQPEGGALVGEGGARHLLCGVCGFVWTFNRVKCPFCGNEDAETLKTLAVDEQTPYRLDACDACRRYVKTVDYRKADPQRAVILPVDDAATVYLDLMAGKEGYSRD